MTHFVPKMTVEDITELYCEEWMTIQAIADMYEKHRSTITNYIKDNGIVRTIPDVLSEENLYALHLQGYRQIDVIWKYDHLPVWLVRRETDKYGFFKRKPSILKSEEKVKEAVKEIEMLLDQGKKVDEIAKRTGINRQTVYELMKVNNLACPRERKFGKISHEMANKLVDEYQTNKSISVAELSEKHQIKERKIYKILKEKGVKLEYRWSKPRPPKVKRYEYVAGSHFETLAGIPDQWHDLEGYEGQYKYNEDGLVCYIGNGRPRLLDMKKDGDDYTYSTKIQKQHEDKLPKMTMTRNEVLRGAGVEV